MKRHVMVCFRTDDITPVSGQEPWTELHTPGALMVAEFALASVDRESRRPVSFLYDSHGDDLTFLSHVTAALRDRKDSGVRTRTLVALPRVLYLLHNLELDGDTMRRSMLISDLRELLTDGPEYGMHVVVSMATTPTDRWREVFESTPRDVWTMFDRQFTNPMEFTSADFVARLEAASQTEFDHARSEVLDFFAASRIACPRCGSGPVTQGTVGSLREAFIGLRGEVPWLRQTLDFVGPDGPAWLCQDCHEFGFISGTLGEPQGRIS